MKKNTLIVIIISLILSIFSYLITSNFIIQWAEKGLMFAPFILLKKIDYIFTDTALWIMPLSHAMYGFFSILKLSYIPFYIFILYLFYYYLTISSFTKINQSFISLVVFSILSVFNILIFRYSFDAEQIIYSTYLNLIVFSIILKENDNSLKNNIFLSLIIGSSFLIRSHLVFVPLLFFIYEISVRKNLKNALILLLLPYTLLIPWTVFSYNMSGEFIFTERGRSDINLITSLCAITNTVEATKEIVKETCKNLDIISLLKLQIIAFYQRAVLFLKTFNVMFLLFLYLIFSKNNKLYRSAIFFTFTFIIIHLLTSIEKRYLFPLGNIFAFIFASSLFKKLSIKNKAYDVILTALIPVILISLMLLTYPFFNSRSSSNPSILLIEGIRDLNYFDTSSAVEKFKKYISSGEYLFTSHIKEVIDIYDGKIDKKGTDLLFNTQFLIFLKLVEASKENEAVDHLIKNWNEISSSYIRNPRNKREKEINEKLTLYIKENSFTIPSFALIGKNIKNAKEICIKANRIVKKAGKKHIFDCEFETVASNNYIKDKCLFNKYNTKVSAKIMNIIELEKEKKFEEALNLADIMIRKTDLYKFYLEKANILYLMGKYDEAYTNYLKAYERCMCASDVIYGKYFTELLIFKTKNQACENIKKLKCPFIPQDINNECKKV